MSDTPQVAPVKVDKFVKHFIALRDKKKLMEEAFNLEKKKVTDVMDKIEGILQGFLEKAGGDGIKTKYGSVYLTTKTTASLADPEAFMDFIIANELFDLLDRRANSTACKEYAEEHNAIPPGVNLNSYTTVGVRRA
jgi:hypothetical protein